MKGLYFKPLKKDSWKVIVGSFGDNYIQANKELTRLRNNFPDFHFRVDISQNKQGGNRNYAIFFGNGLDKDTANKLVSIAKEYKVAEDAYCSIQHWDTNTEYR